MNSNKPRPLILRLLGSRLLWTLLVIALVCAVFYLSSNRLSSNLLDSQAQFVADNVRRSAVQCYAIEGRFPTTEDGAAYLEEHYGLAIDHRRYIVYYESMGDNLIPQIHVVVIAPQTQQLQSQSQSQPQPLTESASQTPGQGNGGE
jgi:hypothetical protein